MPRNTDLIVAPPDRVGSRAGSTRKRSGAQSAAVLPEASLRSVGEAIEGPVTISFESSVTGADAERLWEAYRRNFEPLEELAILQHMFERSEVLEELANPKITKIVGWEGDIAVGIGMLTSHLESVPQISPRYLRAKYPDHAANDTIFYGILVAVSPEHRGLTLFNRLYTEMLQIPARAGGVMAFDICEFNRLAFDADSLMQRVAGSFPGARVDMVDRQTWYVAELPHPLPGR